MTEETVGSAVINSLLPEDMQDPNRVWDKKTAAKVLTMLAKRYPERYKEISHKLLQFGYQAAYLTGGQSFSLKDIAEAQAVPAIRKQIDAETQRILAKWYRKGVLSDDPRVQKEIVEAAMKHHQQLNDAVMLERKKEDSPFYHQAVGTGAQKPGTFNSIIGADLLYVDQEDRPIPVPVVRGYSHGLTPAEYFAGAFGARKGSVDLQKATSDAGFLAKQLAQIAHREVVTGDDSPDPYDTASPTGYPVDTDDPDNEGAYLAYPVAGYPRNTLLTPKILEEIKRKGNPRILVRSLTVGGPANGGIYSYDAGVRESGRRPAVGDFVGISAVQAIAEPLTQGAISCLHPGTRVRMADGSVKKMKDIRVGDYVLGSDRFGHTAPAKVTNVFDNGTQRVYYYRGTGGCVCCTSNHKLVTESRQIKPVWDVLLHSEKTAYIQEGAVRFSSISITGQAGYSKVLDIEVDNEDHLFVLANGLIVSNSKHSGGVIGADSGKAISGFAYVNQMIQVPKRFQNGAVHSTEDGRVSKVEAAPQGGYYIYINGIKHYVGREQGREIPLTVKIGDVVEAGDVLTEGIPNPAMIVKYKGIGEGRRAFVDQFRKAMKNMGQSSHRRNLEALSRGLISYVKLNDEYGDYASDDIVPYAMIASGWEPRPGAVQRDARALTGYYLEKPILHYTIGTRIRPSVVKELESFGIKNIVAHKDPPPFDPEMVRGMEHVSKDPDWGTRLLGGYQKGSLLEAARRGAVSYTEGTSYVPALAFGDSTFGLRGAFANPEKRIY